MDDIKAQFNEMFVFCEQNREWRFLMTLVGAGLAGYSEEEMANTFLSTLEGDIDDAPSNLVIPIDLYGINWSMP